MVVSKIIENAVLIFEQGDSSLAERAPATNKEEKSIVSSMFEKLEDLPQNPNPSFRPTIFRVPARLRKKKEYLIEPSVVSIGPYHRNGEHLKPMEDIKWLLLKNMLFQRNKKVTPTEIIERIKDVQLQARSCYSECIKMDDDSFVEMMILDGTFIIQFMSQSLDWFKKMTGWASAYIATDLILLENQIPFFIVKSLWNIYFGSPIKHTDLKVFKKRLVNDEKLVHFTKPPKKINHLLHLCYHYVVPDMLGHKAVLQGCIDLELCTVLSSKRLLSCISSRDQEPSEGLLKKKEPSAEVTCLLSCISSRDQEPSTGVIIPCATELKEAGIKFRKKRSPCKIMDVTLQGGTLEIPFINIDDSIKPLLVNLLALEQSDFLSNHLTSYVVFMDSLINTDGDVTILQKHGIIGNMLSGEEEVAQFFNQLCDGAVIYTEHYLSELFKKVNQKYNSKYRRYRAKLMRNYLNSPWSILSLLAAFILLGLTFAQTYFAGYTYFHPSQFPN